MFWFYHPQVPCRKLCGEGQWASKPCSLLLRLAWPVGAGCLWARDSTLLMLSILKCKKKGGGRGTEAVLNPLDYCEDELSWGTHVKSLFPWCSHSPCIEFYPSSGHSPNTTSQVNCSLTHLWHLISSVSYTSHVACHLFCPWVLRDSLRHQHFLLLTQSDGNVAPFQ